MKNFMIKTLFLLVTIILTLILIGSILAIFISPLVALIVGGVSIASLTGLCVLNAHYETLGE